MVGRRRDRISLDIIDCEFGLSEVTQATLTTPSGAATAPVPTLNASTIDYHTKLQLNLTKPVVLCVGWASKSAMVNGFQSFTFTRGASPGGVGYNERWSFSFLSSMLWVGVQNIDNTYYMGNDSDSNAFSLSKL